MNEKDRQCYIYDYYLQLALSTVDGETLDRLLLKESSQGMKKLTKSKSARMENPGLNGGVDSLERTSSEVKKSLNLINTKRAENIFHQQSEKPAIALTFFRFSHRDKDNRPLTNKQQELIVDNIFQNIFYLAEHMQPHEFSSTKVPFYDSLIDEHSNKITYSTDSLKMKARQFDKIHNFFRKSDESIYEEKLEPLKLPPKVLSLSIPNFSPFKQDESSAIISETQAIMISRLLPPMIRMREWEKLFSVDVDGISLSTFYKNLHDHSSTILLIQDSNGWKFGCYASSDWEVNRHFYGTGESFLFTFEDTEEQIKTFRWTGGNDNIQYSDNESIAMGGDKGKHALYLRNHFYNGSSHKCSTFDNEVLSSSEDFICAKFEVWGFE